MLRSSPSKPSSAQVLHQHQQIMHPAHHQQATHHSSVLSPSHHLPVSGGPGGVPMFAASCDHPTLRLMAVAAAVAAAASGASPGSSSSNNAPGVRLGPQSGGPTGGGQSRQVRHEGAALGQLQPPPGPNELYASYLYSRGQFDRAAMLHLMQQHHHQQQQQHHHQQQQHNPFTQSAAISSSSTSSSLSASQHHLHQQNQQHRNSQKVSQQLRQSPLFQDGSTPAAANHARPNATSSPEFHSATGIASLPLPPPPYHHQQQQHQQQRTAGSPPLVGGVAPGAPAGFESYSQSLATLSQLSQRLHLHEHLQQVQPYPTPSPLSLSRQHGMVTPFGTHSSSSAARIGPTRRESVEDRSPPIISSPPSSGLIPTGESSTPSLRSPIKSRSRSIGATDEETSGKKFREHQYVFDADEPSPSPGVHHSGEPEFSRLERGRPNGGIDDNDVIMSPRPNELLHRRHRSGHSTTLGDDQPRRGLESQYSRQLSKDSGSHDDGLRIRASSTSKRHDDIRGHRSDESHLRQMRSFDEDSDRHKSVCKLPGTGSGSAAASAATRDWQSVLYSRGKGDNRDESVFMQRPSIPEENGGKRSSTSSAYSGTGMTSRTAEVAAEHAERQFYVKGSVIQLSSGRVKRVEDLDTDDFQIGSSMFDEDDVPDCSSGDDDDEDDLDLDSDVSNFQRCDEDVAPPGEDLQDKRRSLEEQGRKKQRKRTDCVDDGRNGNEKRSQRSKRLVVEASRVVHMRQNHDTGTAVLGFAVGPNHAQVSVEVSLDHPFFVCGLGWSSCCPERTLQHYGLACRRLAIGDTCVSLLRQHQQRSPPMVAPPRVGCSYSCSNASAATSPTMTSSAITMAGGHHHYDNRSTGEHVGVSNSDNRTSPERRGVTLESADPDSWSPVPRHPRRADDGESHRSKPTEHSSREQNQRTNRKRHWSAPDDDVTDGRELTSLQSNGREKQLRAATSGGGCCRDTTSGSDYQEEGQVDYCNNNNNNNGKDTIAMATKAK